LKVLNYPIFLFLLSRSATTNLPAGTASRHPVWMLQVSAPPGSCVRTTIAGPWVADRHVSLRFPWA